MAIKKRPIPTSKKSAAILKANPGSGPKNPQKYGKPDGDADDARRGKKGKK